ncbi:MAG: hypothetical protein FWE76_08890, partial [Symbiobacteriaceae bacterium]|nr:hypothetical protein [Symbiobacteriaceae bacterium]
MPIQTPLQAQVFQPGEYLSNGTVTLKNGQTIPFHTVCQDHLLYDGDKAIGSMFSYSYFRSDVEDPASRPVIFLFNGGPGSGSMWLHAGTFAPWRLKFDDPEGVQQPHLPPYRVENNEYCLLDVADLVFIDPVACGYGRLLDPDAGERFFGMDADATSFDNLIHSWLAKHERWASPKYLLGESYGTSRAALIAESLSGGARLEYAPVYLNGLILLGNNIRTGIANISTNDGVEESVLLLPTAAATNWYHNKLPGTVAEFVAECYAFCEEEYVTALYRGDTIPDELRNHIAEKVAYFAGLSKELVLELNLRPKKNDYLKQVLKDRDLEVGRYDSRFTLPYNRSNAPGFMVRDDPAQAQFAPP